MNSFLRDKRVHHSSCLALRFIHSLDQCIQRLGHDLEFRSGWFDIVASLAAILYVDDTDLLYRIANLDMTDEDFVSNLQAA